MTTVVGCVGDLHHLPNPIKHCRETITRFRYDYLLLTHSQYALLFEIRGIYRLDHNILPFPVCSSLLISDFRTGRTPIPENKGTYQPMMFGSQQSPSTHPFRQIISELAEKSGLVISNNTRLTFDNWIKNVSIYKSILTCSLNGSYSLQTLAPLANGSLLITDQLSKANHIGGKLIHGINCLMYDSPEALTKLLNSLNNCKDSPYQEAIRIRGRELFYSLLDKQISVDKLSGSKISHMRRTVESDFLITRKTTELIEILQELHRVSVRVVALIRTDRCSDMANLSSILAILPRVHFFYLSRESFFRYLQSCGLNPNNNDEIFLHCRTFKKQTFLDDTYLQTLNFRIQRGNNAYKCNQSYSYIEYSTGFPIWPQDTESYHILCPNQFKQQTTF